MARAVREGLAGRTYDVGHVDVGIAMPGEEPVRHMMVRLIRLPEAVASSWPDLLP